MTERPHFRDLFADPAGRETVRAYVIFGALALALLAIAAQMQFRELSLQVLVNRMDLGQNEADRIARTITQLGGDGRSIDFSRVRAHGETLRTMIDERLSQRPFIHHVEVRDRFGVPQLFVSRAGDAAPVAPSAAGLLPETWSASSVHVVWASLGLGEGQVGVAVSSGPIIEEVQKVRRTLQVRLAIAAAAAMTVLIAGFFYVLYLLRKNRRLEQARQSAARASYVGLLASGLAHEIRNPLNAISMNLQMLEEELTAMPETQEAEMGELLDDTKSEIERLVSLVNNFLAYARPPATQPEPRDLNDVVRSVSRLLEADFKRRQVELIADVEPLLPAVDIDETQIKQALINLLVNARQVLKPGGHVVVRTRAGIGGEIVVEVEDDGPGIPVDKRERIFEVFYSSRGGGTGLGLPIARQIVERHGGTIEVDSVVGRGTIFRLRLPRRHDAPVREAAS